MLWLQETYAEPYSWTNDIDSEVPLYQAADHKTPRTNTVKWKSPVMMPREYSRLNVRITAVTPKRVMQISEEEAMLTGVEPSRERFDYLPHRAGLSWWWSRTYGKRDGYEWTDFSWVWVLVASRCKD